MENIISFVHHKGGTGKTTSCINIAGYLKKLGKKILVVDLDPQGNATTGLGVDKKSIDFSIYDVMFEDKKMQDIILETTSGIHLAPSSIDLLAADTHFSGNIDQTTILWNCLEEIEPYYDYILIDLPPGSTMLMTNGIVAAKELIIVTDSGVFAYEGMEMLRTLLSNISEELGIERKINCVLLKEQPGIIKNSTRQILSLMKNFLTIHYSGLVPEIYTLPYSNKVYESQMKGIPISHFAARSNIGKIFNKITKEVISNGHTK